MTEQQGCCKIWREKVASFQRPWLLLHHITAPKALLPMKCQISTVPLVKGEGGGGRKRPGSRTRKAVIQTPILPVFAAKLSAVRSSAFKRNMLLPISGRTAAGRCFETGLFSRKLENYRTWYREVKRYFLIPFMSVSPPPPFSSSYQSI